jgi:hypothetical protein
MQYKDFKAVWFGVDEVFDREDILEVRDSFIPDAMLITMIRNDTGLT